MHRLKYFQLIVNHLLNNSPQREIGDLNKLYLWDFYTNTRPLEWNKRKGIRLFGNNFMSLTTKKNKKKAKKK